jgi:hypothetical protein
VTTHPLGIEEMFKDLGFAPTGQSLSFKANYKAAYCVAIESELGIKVILTSCTSTYQPIDILVKLAISGGN